MAMSPFVYNKLPIYKKSYPGLKCVSLNAWMEIWRSMTIEQRNDERISRRHPDPNIGHIIFVNGEWIY